MERKCIRSCSGKREGVCTREVAKASSGRLRESERIVWLIAGSPRPIMTRSGKYCPSRYLSVFGREKIERFMLAITDCQEVANQGNFLSLEVSHCSCRGDDRPKAYPKSYPFRLYLNHTELVRNNTTIHNILIFGTIIG
jgi:hypothetical protein